MKKIIVISSLLICLFPTLKVNAQQVTETSIETIENPLDDFSDLYINYIKNKSFLTEHEKVVLQQYNIALGKAVAIEKQEEWRQKQELKQLEVENVIKGQNIAKERQKEWKERQNIQKKTKRKTYNTINLSESEIYMLAQLIYLEAGGTSYECQLAVGSVTINLMKNEHKSLYDTIYTPGRFTVASKIQYTTPSKTSLNAAYQLATKGTTLPSNVKCFRNNHYFTWGTPYCNIDNVYFSCY